MELSLLGRLDFLLLFLLLVVVGSVTVAVSRGNKFLVASIGVVAPASGTPVTLTAPVFFGAVFLGT